MIPNDSAGPRRGKRVAVISAATAAAVAVAAIAIAVGTGGDDDSAKRSARIGDPLSGVDPGSGAFPAGGSMPGGGAGAGNPTSGASAANPGGAAVPDSSSPASGGTHTSSGPSGSQTSHGTTSPRTTSKSSASKTTSKPASSPKSTTAAPAHKAPAPLSASEVKVNIPDWYLVAGIDVAWGSHADATGYVVHFTASDGTDENISIPDPWYSYQVDKGLTTCVQVKAVNQYGETPFTPKDCVDPAPHQIH